MVRKIGFDDLVVDVELMMALCWEILAVGLMSSSVAGRIDHDCWTAWWLSEELGR